MNFEVFEKNLFRGQSLYSIESLDREVFIAKHF